MSTPSTPSATGARTTRGVRPVPPPAGAPASPPAGPLPGPPAGSRPAGGISRVSVLAPSTRVDVALPADVPVAELLGVLADMAGEPPSAGGSAPAAWTLAPLGAAPVDPAHTLADLGVLDGDQLVLRRRAAAAAGPLYDDVADAVAEAPGASGRPWDAAVADRLGLAGLAAGIATAVILLVAAGRGAGTAGGLGTAALAAGAAVLGLGLGTAFARRGRRPAAGAVAALGGAVCAAVAAVAVLPGAPGGSSLVAGSGAAHLLLGGAVLALAAGTTPTLLGGVGRTAVAASAAFVAAGVLGTATGIGLVLAATVAAPGGGPDAAAGAAGAGALAVAALSALPRAGLALARLPVPPIATTAEELAADIDPTPADDVAERTGRAHALLAGLLAGTAGVVVPAVAVLVAAAPAGGRGIAATGLAVLLVALLAARARTYAGAVPAGVLLVGAIAAGVAGLLAAVPAGAPGAALLVAAVLALAAAGLALVLGTVVPRRRFSPVARRSAEVLEAVGIVAVLPLALAVMDLYRAMRLL